MKIITWNCNGAFRKKLSLMRSLDPDVMIIQECENPEAHEKFLIESNDFNYLWRGLNKNKGLCIFAKKHLLLQEIGVEFNSPQIFIPCAVNGMRILCVWTKEAGSPTFGYIGQLYKWLSINGDFLRGSPILVIGDFNSNSIWDVWDRWWNHSDVVKMLEERGLKSVYHALRGEEQGFEKEKTFFLYKKKEKPYHIDFAFLTKSMVPRASLEIGGFNHWIEFSDHMPLVLDLRDAN